MGIQRNKYLFALFIEYFGHRKFTNPIFYELHFSIYADINRYKSIDFPNICILCNNAANINCTQVNFVCWWITQQKKNTAKKQYFRQDEMAKLIFCKINLLFNFLWMFLKSPLASLISKSPPQALFIQLHSVIWWSHLARKVQKQRVANSFSPFFCFLSPLKHPTMDDVERVHARVEKFLGTTGGYAPEIIFDGRFSH